MLTIAEQKRVVAKSRMPAEIAARAPNDGPMEMAMCHASMSRRTLLAALSAGAVTASAATVTKQSPRGTGAANWKLLDKLVAEAVANKDAPFVVAVVTDHKGIVWQGAAGQAGAALQAGPEVIFDLYSDTKAIGSLAAMILVDRGKIALDTPVASILPEFASIKVLESMSPAGPVYRDPVRPVTLRHLLTHTSGLAYGVWDKKDLLWEAHSQTPNPNVSTMEAFTHPLMFDPGTGWTYGVGIDWVGFVAEKVDGRSIDQFVYQEILGPLQMYDTMFETYGVASRLSTARIRGVDGNFNELKGFTLPRRPPVYGMGQALHGTALDYAKFQRLVLNDGEVHGRRIVSRQAMALMKQNQIGAMRLPFPMKSNIDVCADLDLFPGMNIPLTHTAAFVRNEVDVPGRRRAGSLTWSGVLNTHHWIDPSSGIAAVLFTQSLPFLDPRFLGFYDAFERAVYGEWTKR
jgi:CubicO group peptidase (beta-lactamase class C family)